MSNYDNPKKKKKKNNEYAAPSHRYSPQKEPEKEDDFQPFVLDGGYLTFWDTKYALNKIFQSTISLPFPLKLMHY